MRADSRESPRSLYPPIQPYFQTHLDVGDGHKIYLEQSGNPDGIPVLFLHGGPGGGTSPVQRRFFNPEHYRIILFDQRGCGRSLPHASLDANTTWHLVDDIEKIRNYLGIKRWILFGGSWGSTLALLYAQNYPASVAKLILRGIFLLRQRELDWFYRNGTSQLFPEAYNRFLSVLPADKRHDPISAYYDYLTDTSDRAQQLSFAKEWSLWEGSTVTLMPDETQKAHVIDPLFALAFARIESHFFHHRGFLPSENYILENAEKISHIPTIIVQGRYDVICPPMSAWELATILPNSKLEIVPVAGHSAFESQIQHGLITATDNAVAEFYGMVKHHD